MTISEIPPTERAFSHITWTELQAAADRARLAYDYEQAAGFYSQALTEEDIPTLDRYDLLSGRAQCFAFLGRVEAGLPDLYAMWHTAKALNDCSRMVETAVRFSETDLQPDQVEAAKPVAQESLANARQVGDPILEARALSALGRIYFLNNENASAREALETALNQQLEMEDRLGEARTRLNYSQLLSRSEPALASEQATLALSLFRSLGDRFHQASALNLLGLTTGDHARARAYHEQAQAIYRSINDRHGQPLMENNLAVMYSLLGLFTRARQYASRAVAAARQEGNRKSLSYYLDTLAVADFELHHYDAAQANMEEGLATVHGLGDRYLEGAYLLRLGRLALAKGDLVGATVKLESAVNVLEEAGDANGQANTLAWLGAAYLASGNLVEAERCTRQACTLLSANKSSTSEFPLQDIPWWRYRVLKELSEEPTPPGPLSLRGKGDEEGSGYDAYQTLADAHRRMIDAIASLSDPGLRRNYLNKVEINREIVLEWARQANDATRQEERTRTEPQAAWTGGQEQLKRMLEISLQMNESRDVSGLLEFIVEELVELSGAERAILVLRDEVNVGTTITRGVPVSEIAVLERQVVGLLEEGKISLEPHLLEDVLTLGEESGELPAITHRSVVILPLIAHGQLTGLIYADCREIFGPFTPEDLDLLSVFANQAATALENARWSSELEERVSLRTAELQAANLQMEQRNAELAIINRVSQAMSRQLDVEAIIKIVGDEVRDSFQVECTNIYLYDPLTNLISSPYYFDRGYLSMEPFPFGKGLTSTVIRTRQPLILGTREEMDKLMAVRFYIKPGDVELTQSYLGVPVIIGDQVIGVVSIQSYSPHAYTERHLSLLSTLGASLGVALENARLFQETRRLLAETEQRAVELETVSRISQALSAQLELNRLIELVGQQVQATFDADIAYVAMLDRAANLIRFPYTFGEKHPPLPFGKGLTSRILETGETLLLNRELNVKREQMGVGLVGTAALSYLGVPIKVGDEAVGVISVQSTQAEGMFDENDLRLLSTIAANVSAAFQNAHLYGEIQRRAEEMAALAEISNEIAATHILQSVLEHIARRAKDLMQVRDISISLFENDGERLRPAVAFGKYAQEMLADSIKVGEGITGSVAQSGFAEISNFPELDPRAHHIPGTLNEEEEAECLMIAPMVLRGQVTGLITVWRERAEGMFKQAELDFLVSLARQAAIALENARLYMEIERRANQMATVAEVGREVSATLDLQAVLASIAGRVHSLFNAEDTILRLIQPDGQTFQTVVALGKYADQFKDDIVALGEGIIGAIAQTGVAEVIADVSKDPRGKHVSGTPDEEEAPETMMCAPLIARGQTIGLISLYRAVLDGQFTQVDLDFLTSLARQAAIAVENARLFEAAQESHRRLSDIIDFLPDATLVIDRQGRVIAWNRAMEEMTGVKAENILGKGEFQYAVPFYGDRRPILIDLVLLPNEEVEKKYAHLQRQGNILIGETHVPLLQGRSAYLYATASALRNSKGELVGAIETIRDISDRKRAEQELELARAEAEAARHQAETANQAKSAFLAMMSHEIRTPMNAIIGMSGLILDTPLNDEQRDFAETIRSSSDALLTIINDILDFSKIEAGRMELEIQPFDVRECVETSLDLVKVRAGEKGLELAYQMDAGVPPALLGDVTRLRQVLINLLGNAVKFTQEGEIVLSVTREEGEKLLHFSVKDTGIGIPTGRIAHLFQPFTQADASTSRRYGGTGLGLALSKRLVEMMGGTIWVESEGIPGKGSTFHFTILAQPAPDWKAGLQLVGDQALLHGRRLLVVDDSPTNRRILALQTQAWGMLAQAAATPGEALEWLRRGEPFDLAIIDLQMPEMDGVHLAGEIRKLENAAHLPLVLLSSLGGHESVRESTEFAAVLAKPLRQSALFDVLVTIFTQKPQPSIRTRQERQTLDAGMAARHPLRILLAEDNVVNQKLALRLLSQMGYRADLAANGLEVLQAVARQPYDTLLMDVQMPEMDGLEATRRLCAELLPGQRPRIIAMTANAMQGDREMCLEAGMDDYLSKPIRVDELVRALERCRSAGQAPKKAG